MAEAKSVIESSEGDQLAEAKQDPSHRDRSELPLSLAQLECLIEDDTYKLLQRHFLTTTEKESCPDLTVLRVTNRLLVQLFFLRKKLNSRCKEPKLWLEKLVPNTTTVPESRVRHEVSKIIDYCTHVSEEMAASFLQEEHNFHALSEPLAVLGLNRLHLIGAESYCEPPSETISNEVVVALEHFKNKERESQKFMLKWIKRLCAGCESLSERQLKNKVAVTLKKYKQWNSSRKRRGDGFLKETFMDRALQLSLLSKQQCIETDDRIKIRDRQIKEQKKIIQKLESSNARILSRNKELSAEIKLKNEVIEEIQREKMDLFASFSKVEQSNQHLQNEILNLRKELESEHEQVEVYQTELELFKKSDLYKPNHARKRKLNDVGEENSALLKVINESKIESMKLIEQFGALKNEVKSEPQ